jgi:undecaprenyl-diphosphatase
VWFNDLLVRGPGEKLRCLFDPGCRIACRRFPCRLWSAALTQPSLLSLLSDQFQTYIDAPRGNILCAAAALWWFYCRDRPAPQRKASDHVLVTTIVATVLPHLLKHIFTQERPDRVSVEAHLHGAPFSGSPLQSFPSGHAIHVGALGSAAADLPSIERNLVWAAGGGLLLTRVILLAHWASDVATGLIAGVVLERIIRIFTGYGRGGDA